MNSTRFRARGAAVRSVIAALVVGLVAVQNTGCGQRGPLYLPEPGQDADSQAQTENAAPATGPAGEGEAAGSADKEEKE